MDKIKQVIVVRKDLTMRKGKIIAQAGHAVMQSLLNYNKSTQFSDDEVVLNIKIPEMFFKWLSAGSAKICVYVDSEDELLSIYDEAVSAGLNCSLITDEGLTEFKGIHTKTVCSIGPDYSSKIDPITRKLKLL